MHARNLISRSSKLVSRAPYDSYTPWLTILLPAVVILVGPRHVAAGSCPNRGTDWVGIVGPSIAPRDLVATRKGDVLMCGDFFSNVDFDPTDGVDQRVGSGDAYVLKINSDGSYAWAYTVGGVGLDAAAGVVSLRSGEILVAGGFSESVDFDPGPRVDERNAVGHINAFLTKLDSDGAYLETLTFGEGDDNVGPTGMGIDGKENIYFVGSFVGNADFDPSEDIDLHQSTPVFDGFSRDIFLTKLASDGTYEWTRTFGAGGFDVGDDIAIDDQDDIFIAGTFRNTVDFDFGPGVDNHTSIGVDNLFVTKVMSDGSYGWTRSYPIRQPSAQSIAVDSTGAVYLTGIFGDTVDFDRTNGVDVRVPTNDEGDIFVTKSNSDGSYGWTWTVGGLGQDLGRGVTVDAEDNVYVAGQFMDIVDFDHSAEVDVHTSLGGDDTFVTLLTADGSYLWTRTFGGITRVAARFIAVDVDGNVIVVGNFISFEGLEVDLDPSCEEIPGVEHFPGFSDTYINKLVCPDLSADHDGNGRVDLRDYAAFQNCFTGTVHGGEPLPACNDGCATFDMDPTDTINRFDYAKDAFILTGP